MNNYRFSPLIVVRTPAYSYRTYTHDDTAVRNALSDSFFRASIALASDSLYQQLKAADFIYDRLAPKVRLSLRKYLNRMCFRSIPFGLFAGTTTIQWGQQQPVVFSDKLRPHVLYSFEQVIADAAIAGNSPATPPYRLNESIYTINSSYRYLKCDKDASTGKQKFYLHELQITPILSALAGHCNTARSLEEMIAFVDDQCNSGAERSRCFVDGLIAQQLIVPALTENNIDKAYLVANTEIPELPGTDVNVIYAQLASGQESTTAPSGRSRYYVHLDMPVAAGALDTRLQEHIREGIACMARLTPASKPGELETFKAEFRKRFDLQLVPLLAALDPETGVNYERLAGMQSSSVLLRQIGLGQKQEKAGSTIHWSPVHALFMQRWQPSAAVINITAEDLAQLPHPQPDIALPNSMSVMFRPLHDGVVIESAGGVSATALAARFSVFDKGILADCRSTARLTEQANPNVIFADINHYCDPHTANIDRRAQIWSYEIPVLTGSAMPQEQQLLLSDLYIAVDGDRVVLWSKSINKEVIPVLTSAFNYLRSDLAVFRFLCDLQHQGIHTDLTFDLERLFPGLSYYPRVAYGAAILQLATWHIKEDAIAAIRSKPLPAERHKALRLLVEGLKLPRMISVNEHDNQLVFDTTCAGDLEFLWDTIKNAGALTIKEFPYIESSDEGSSPTGDKKYLHQMVASMVHNEEIYKCLYRKPASTGEGQRKFMPGSEWLYCKLYCHPTRANELLSTHISTHAQVLISKGILKQWFFIRYNDPGYHLRTRFHVAEQYVGEAIALLRKSCNALVASGIISSFTIDVYERELERYGTDMIADAEEWFCASTTAVTAPLQAGNMPDKELVRMAFLHADTICCTFDTAISERSDLFRRWYEALSMEFSISSAQNEQLKRRYREVNESGLLPHGSASETGTIFGQACKVLYAKIADRCPERREQLLADLLHMHLNRVFVSEARKQEMVVYYCLWKYYSSMNARMNLSVSSVCS